MIKHIFLSSLQGALVTTIFQFIVFSFEYDFFYAGLFTLFIFPIAFILCALLGTPLILIKKNYKIPEPYYFMLFVILGAIFGTLSPSIFFGEKISLLDIFYGLGGVVASTSVWFYAHRTNL
ncbi:MAG: hypothetical protein COB26_12010 [Piscirickettsiaceae bacterium]|nr:MAG: hypothetical protein COB26_12010 [Piscirickettsiaceae bacterium]